MIIKFECDTAEQKKPRKLRALYSYVRVPRARLMELGLLTPINLVKSGLQIAALNIYSFRDSKMKSFSSVI